MPIKTYAIGSWMLDAYLAAGWKVQSCQRVTLPGIDREYDEYKVVWDDANGPEPVIPNPSDFQEPTFRDVPPKPRRR